ncbi:MAG: hypothetical protein ABIZ80_01990 [Bryobacteraceae bacterium]
MNARKWIAGIALSLGCVWVGTPAIPTIDIGSRKQLFIDHKFIESAEGVSLAMNPPWQNGEVLIAPDASWEKDTVIGSYGTVVAENGKIRIWYPVLGKDHLPHKNPDYMGLAYAESDDGIHFRKPELGLVEYKGDRRNNLVLPVDPKLMSIGGGSVLIDENPNCPPGERYKSWQKIYPKPNSGIRGPYRIWVSPDGLRWKLSEKLVTGLRAADTQPSWFWEPEIARYVGYSREWTRFANGRPIRMASYNESDDLHAWEKMQIALEPDDTDFAADLRPMVDPARMKIERETWVPSEMPARRIEQREGGTVFDDPVPIPGAPLDIYGPGVFPYREADGVYISLLSAFHHWKAEERGSWPDTADVRLAVSRDRRHFIQPGARQPFLRVGHSGSFDSKWIWAFPKPVRRGDELWIYYFGTNQDHGSRADSAAKERLTAIARAVMRLDGFVSADFDYAGGTLMTPPIRFTGRRLELNLDTGAGGVGRVEIVRGDGSPIPGFTMLDADQLNGNSVRLPVSWKGKSDLSALAGQEIRLRLKMRAAKLYAFQFR